MIRKKKERITPSIPSTPSMKEGESKRQLHLKKKSADLLKELEELEGLRSDKTLKEDKKDIITSTMENNLNNSNEENMYKDNKYKLKKIKDKSRSKLDNIMNIPTQQEKGNIPNLLDYGVTHKEAVFITEYVKDYDEIKAGKAARLIDGTMSRMEMDKRLNSVLLNPNVAKALQGCLQDQIYRTLVTSDRVITQIAKIAFNDPLGLYKEDGSGTIRDMKDIPPALRYCISEITNTNIYDGRGDDRRVVGHISKIKLHDSLKALQIILKDIREKGGLTGKITLNQYNYGTKNIRENLKDLSDSELDVLLKLSNTGSESLLNKTKLIENKPKDSKDSEVLKDFNIEDNAEDIIELARAKDLKDGTQLYGLDELKSIEQSNM